MEKDKSNCKLEFSLVRVFISVILVILLILSTFTDLKMPSGTENKDLGTTDLKNILDTMSYNESANQQKLAEVLVSR